MRVKEPTGEEALLAYTTAKKLVTEGKFDEAREVHMRIGDRVLIEALIVATVAKAVRD